MPTYTPRSGSSSARVSPSPSIPGLLSAAASSVHLASTVSTGHLLAAEAQPHPLPPHVSWLATHHASLQSQLVRLREKYRLLTAANVGSFELSRVQASITETEAELSRIEQQMKDARTNHNTNYGAGRIQRSRAAGNAPPAHQPSSSIDLTALSADLNMDSPLDQELFQQRIEAARKARDAFESRCGKLAKPRRPSSQRGMSGRRRSSSSSSSRHASRRSSSSWTRRGSAAASIGAPSVVGGGGISIMEEEDEDVVDGDGVAVGSSDWSSGYSSVEEGMEDLLKQRDTFRRAASGRRNQSSGNEVKFNLDVGGRPSSGSHGSGARNSSRVRRHLSMPSAALMLKAQLAALSPPPARPSTLPRPLFLSSAVDLCRKDMHAALQTLLEHSAQLSQANGGDDQQQQQQQQHRRNHATYLNDSRRASAILHDPKLRDKVSTALHKYINELVSAPPTLPIPSTSSLTANRRASSGTTSTATSDAPSSSVHDDVTYAERLLWGLLLDSLRSEEEERLVIEWWREREKQLYTIQAEKRRRRQYKSQQETMRMSNGSKINMQQVSSEPIVVPPLSMLNFNGGNKSAAAGGGSSVSAPNAGSNSTSSNSSSSSMQLHAQRGAILNKLQIVEEEVRQLKTAQLLNALLLRQKQYAPSTSDPPSNASSVPNTNISLHPLSPIEPVCRRFVYALLSAALDNHLTLLKQDETIRSLHWEIAKVKRIRFLTHNGSINRPPSMRPAWESSVSIPTPMPMLQAEVDILTHACGGKLDRIHPNAPAILGADEEWNSVKIAPWESTHNDDDEKEHDDIRRERSLSTLVALARAGRIDDDDSDASTDSLLTPDYVRRPGAWVNPPRDPHRSKQIGDGSSFGDSPTSMQHSAANVHQWPRKMDGHGHGRQHANGASNGTSRAQTSGGSHLRRGLRSLNQARSKSANTNSSRPRGGQPNPSPERVAAQQPHSFSSHDRSRPTTARKCWARCGMEGEEEEKEGLDGMHAGGRNRRSDVSTQRCQSARMDRSSATTHDHASPQMRPVSAMTYRTDVPHAHYPPSFTPYPPSFAPYPPTPPFPYSSTPCPHPSRPPMPTSVPTSFPYTSQHPPLFYPYGPPSPMMPPPHLPMWLPPSHPSLTQHTPHPPRSPPSHTPRHPATVPVAHAFTG